MIHNKKNQNFIHYGFTLIEMMIVLIIIGILLMMMLYLSSDQIQKVKDKTVKESILAEMQSRYSRNLGSSSYAGILYKYLDISISSGSNKIEFNYEPRDSDSEGVNNEFISSFVIENIITDTLDVEKSSVENLTLRYHPYQIACEWGSKNSDGSISTGNMNDELLLITKVNDSGNYCFEIQQKNCRLVEVSKEKCEIIEVLAN